MFSRLAIGPFENTANSFREKKISWCFYFQRKEPGGSPTSGSPLIQIKASDLESMELCSLEQGFLPNLFPN